MTTQTRVADIELAPSVKRAAAVRLEIAESIPDSASAVSVPIGAEGPVPSHLGVDRAALDTAGFTGEVGKALLIPGPRRPMAVAVGIGRPAIVDSADVRNAAAAFARAASKHAHLAVTLDNTANVPTDDAAQAVVEGVLLARYRYDTFRGSPSTTEVEQLTLIAHPDRHAALRRGAARGRATAAAAQLARDLANAPATHMTATRMAQIASTIAAERGLHIEIYDREALLALGCGGLLGVNAGSTEPPRMIKLTYRPRGGSGNGSQPRGHVTMVGKGVMYDSGGISLKPSDASHQAMKMDMSGAAAILGAMSALSELECRSSVTGYLMCTDNMPSGTATRLGDVLTIRGGTTVEVNNADAEGRLILADGLVLATEEQPDAIIDIATLTGAMMRALGDGMAGVIGNHQALIDQVVASGRITDELVWQMPLNKRYRLLLDSDVADMRNIGGENAGSIVGALFLAEFVGAIPWAHIDIAGTMKADADDSWRSKGAIGFGTRLLIDLALNFTSPQAPGGAAL